METFTELIQHWEPLRQAGRDAERIIDLRLINSESESAANC